MTTPEALARTHAACFVETRPWAVKEFTTLMSQPTTLLIGDETCFALIRRVADEAEILTLATHPDHQKQGKARRLLGLLEDRLGAQAGSVFLEVDAANTAARALYAACDYDLAGRRPGYYTHPQGPRTDALLLRKDLARSPKV